MGDGVIKTQKTATALNLQNGLAIIEHICVFLYFYSVCYFYACD